MKSKLEIHGLQHYQTSSLREEITEARYVNTLPKDYDYLFFFMSMSIFNVDGNTKFIFT